MRDPMSGRLRTGLLFVTPDVSLTPRVPPPPREGFGFFLPPGEPAPPPPPREGFGFFLPPGEPGVPATPPVYRAVPARSPLLAALAGVQAVSERARQTILAGAARLSAVSGGFLSPPGVAVHMGLADAAASAADAAALSARDLSVVPGATAEQFAPLLAAAQSAEATVIAEVALAEQIQLDSLPRPDPIRLRETYDAKLDEPPPSPSSSATPLLVAGAAALLIGGGWWYYRSRRTQRSRE